MTALCFNMATVELDTTCFHLERVTSHGPRELAWDELGLIDGGINWGQVGQAAGVGAVSGAVGGAVTGGLAGAFVGGIGAGPGALAGAGLGGIGGAMTGAIASVMTQYMAE